MVRVKGVEPPRLAAPDPKSGASANSATPAYKWLGYQDSNLGMTESKSVALPLGYTPIIMVEGGGFEPPNPKGTDLQSVAFSHFATPPNVWWRMTGSNRRPSACKADALPAELILQMLVLLN